MSLPEEMSTVSDQLSIDNHLKCAVLLTIAAHLEARVDEAVLDWERVTVEYHGYGIRGRGHSPIAGVSPNRRGNGRRR